MALDANNEIINSASGIVVQGTAVAGGYFVTDTIASIPSYANKTGQLCYVTGTVENPVNAFYQYNGIDWILSTSVANHYDPTADTNAALSAVAKSSTEATWNTTSFVTGVDLQRDAKGHVTGVTVGSRKMPANPLDSYVGCEGKIFIVTDTNTGNGKWFTVRQAASGAANYITFNY